MYMGGASRAASCRLRLLNGHVDKGSNRSDCAYRYGVVIHGRYATNENIKDLRPSARTIATFGVPSDRLDIIRSF